MNPPLEQLTDAELVHQHRLNQRGDAFRELTRRYKRRVWAVIYRSTGHYQDAEDLLQEVFLRVHRHMGSYDSSRPLHSWIYKIAANVVVDYLNRRRARPELLDVIPFDRQWNASSPEDRAAARLLTEKLRSAIGRLPEDQQPVVVMRYFMDMDLPEIAAATGHPVGTIKTWLHRSRNQLAEILEDNSHDVRLPHLRKNQ
ncbi:MAG: ECF RNA polymerase sigma factor SigW [Myxococcota bacterium]|nr:ECF RNA polymerase sigma factor SigW [Myxococcota bacterium]